MRRLLQLTFLCLLVSGATMAQTKFWVAPGASGNWNVAANWSLTSGGAGGAGAPTAAQNAVFDGGSAANCLMPTPTAISVNNFTVNTTYTGTISQPATNILIVNGDVVVAGGTLNIPGTSVINGTYTQSGGTVTLGSSPATSTTMLNTASFTGGTFNIGGPIQFDGNLNVTNPGVTINPGTSAVTFDGSVNRVININGGASGTVTFYDVILEKSNPGGQNLNVAANDQIVVLNDLTLANGSLGTGTGTVHVGGDLTIESGFLGALVDLVIDGAGNSNVVVDAPFKLAGNGIITVNKTNPASTVSFSTTLASNDIVLSTGAQNGSFNITSGTVQFPDNDAATINFAALNIGAAGTLSAPNNNLTIPGNFATAGTFIPNTGTTILNGAGVQTVSINGPATPGTLNFYNLTLNNTSGAGNINVESGDIINVANDLSITNGRINVAGAGGSATVQVGGNLTTTTAAADATTNEITLAFTGGNAQTVSLFAGTQGNFNGPIIFNKTGGDVTLASTFIVDQANQTVTFTSGVLNTTATNYIQFIGNNVTWTGANNNSYVDGIVRRTGTSSFIFPTGDGGFYAPVNLSGTTAFNGAMGLNPGTNLPPTYAVQYVRSNPQDTWPNNPPQPTDGNAVPTVLTLSRQEYFIVDFVSDIAGFPPTDYPAGNEPYIFFSYEDQRSGGLTDPSIVIPVSWRTNHWNNEGPTVAPVINAGISYIRSGIRATSIADNNPVFTFATNNPLLNPLPVEWIDFTGRRTGSTVELAWITASEKNNLKFVVERSADGKNFGAIGSVDGNGTTNVTSQYTFSDKSPLNEAAVYRIKQTDDNGKFSYSKEVRVAGIGATIAGIRLYPNPAPSSAALYLENSSWRNQKVKVSIINSIGAVVREEQINFSGDSRAKVNISGIGRGSYYMSTFVNGEKKVVPFIIQ